MTSCFVAGVRSNSSYMPASGSETSFSATRYSVGMSRPHPKSSVTGRIPGFLRELPAGASATIAWMRRSTSGAASAVQPPKLCPTIPTRAGSGIASELTRGRAQELIEEQSDVGHTIRDHGFHARLPVRARFTIARPERSSDLEVIQGGDDVPVTTQVGAQERRPAPMVPAGVRENNQRVRSGIRCGVADRLLASRRGADGEDVLRFWRKILARICRRCRVPDLARERADPVSVKSLNGPHANRESPAKEGVVVAACHQSLPYQSLRLRRAGSR